MVVLLLHTFLSLFQDVIFVEFSENGGFWILHVPTLLVFVLRHDDKKKLFRSLDPREKWVKGNCDAFEEYFSRLHSRGVM